MAFSPPTSSCAFRRLIICCSAAAPIRTSSSVPHRRQLARLTPLIFCAALSQYVYIPCFPDYLRDNRDLSNYAAPM
ncbi:MAG: hypothetical protein ACR2QC_00535, partial [Gammaproteobacteria bacterium]